MRDASDEPWDPARREYAERLALVLTQAGLQRMAARIMAALLVDDDDALTAGELVDRLGASAAAISVAVRQMEEIGVVTRTRRAGERSDRFQLPGFAYATFGRDRLMATWRDVAAEGIGVVGAKSPAGARLREMHDFLDFAVRQMPEMYERWLASRE